MSDEELLSRRIGLRSGMWCALANLDGAVSVYLYLAHLVPAESTEHGKLYDVVGFVLYMAVAMPVVAFLCTRSHLRVTSWFVERRTPTPAERRRMLSEPARQATLALGAWAGAAVFFPLTGSLVGGHTAADNWRIVGGTVVGALTTTGLTYLLVERTYRPLFAAALASGPPDGPARVGLRGRLVLTWAFASGAPLLGLVLLPIAARDATIRADIDAAVAALAAYALVVGALTTVVAAKSLAEPLDDLRHALRHVEEGDLEVHVDVDDAGEIGLLQSGINHMAAELRERERVRDLFGRHVGREVARHALEAGTGLGGEQRDVSALFVDIVGSTAMAEVLAPEEVVATLNDFFTAVVEAVGAEGGWVNKFEGDGALCVFGTPATQPDHAARALRAARALHGRLDILRSVHPGLEAGIGVSSGPAVAGNIGTESRYEYTVVGRPVNEAARLCDLAKGHDGRVLASGAAVARAGDEAAHWDDMGTVALRGASAPTRVLGPASRGPAVTAPTPAP